eukprot:7798165-Alexandrium_andersonii.AAC.1
MRSGCGGGVGEVARGVYSHLPSDMPPRVAAAEGGRGRLSQLPATPGRPPPTAGHGCPPQA